jgi:hypothetical protein
MATRPSCEEPQDVLEEVHCMEQTPPQNPVTLERALVLFELTEVELITPESRTRLDHKRRQLLLIWHPHRYANLTNNPKKYMKMYKQGEAMTKEIQSAYEVLIARLENNEGKEQSGAT